MRDVRKKEAKNLRNRSRRAADGGDSRLAQFLAELARSSGRRKREAGEDWRRAMDLNMNEIRELSLRMPISLV